MMPTNTVEAMFSSCQQLDSLDVSFFDTSNVTHMGSMFSDCKALSALDVCNFNTSKMTSMTSFFNSCNNLATIYLSDGWTTATLSGANSCSNTFLNCINLMGGNGTTYAASNPRDPTYAHIDVEGNPGYFTCGFMMSDVNLDGQFTIADIGKQFLATSFSVSL